MGFLVPQSTSLKLRGGYKRQIIPVTLQAALVRHPITAAQHFPNQPSEQGRREIIPAMSKTKMLTLYFKRAKLFLLHSGENGERRFVTGPTKEGPIQVPAWVAETQTYQLSIKDGSIVNLTPPEPIAAVVVEPEPEPDGKVPEDGGVTEDDEDDEPEAAKAPAKKSSRGAKLGLTK